MNLRDGSVYYRFTEWFAAHPRAAHAAKPVNRALTLIFYVLYPLLLLYFLLQKDSALCRAVLVPMGGFLILSVFRALYNRPRPYEKLNLKPVIPKKTRGRSFPSRHVFSAMVIALTFLLWSPFRGLGALLILLAAALAALRVVTCMHFISDVLAGIGFALLCAVCGYIIF